ncbi:MAG: aspartate/glutamate racemase family protein [Clostridia bacterium]|nr:aspartate/glutamate racemase family protein [Clostridia bacterium]
MKKKRIVFVDSGSGGLHILAKAQKLLPHYEMIYLADTFNAPYGNKSKRKLEKIAENLVEFINTQFNPEIIVLACNTLTMNTISRLREEFYRTKFVGVEPALKQAKIYGGDTIIFATKSTIRNYKKLNKKISLELKSEYEENGLEYPEEDKVFRVALSDCAQLIDQHLDDLSCLRPLLEKTFSKPKYKNCENLVLGCTHYIAIKEVLNDIFERIRFFDGTTGVANRIRDIARFPKPKNKQQTQEEIAFENNREYVDRINRLPKNVKIITTDGDRRQQAKFERYFLKLLE